jgi:hypothetical protein
MDKNDRTANSDSINTQISIWTKAILSKSEIVVTAKANTLCEYLVNITNNTSVKEHD